MSTPNPNNSLPTIIDEAAPLPRIIKALEEALVADVVNRDGTRGPDHRTRTDAAKTLLAYRVGTPIQRSESISVNVDADSATGMRERLAHSPALRAMFRKMLDEVGTPAIDA